MGEPTAGQRIIEAVKEAIAFLKGEDNGCVVHEVIADGKHRTGRGENGGGLPQTERGE